jgi:hypothetical protein
MNVFLSNSYSCNSCLLKRQRGKAGRNNGLRGQSSTPMLPVINCSYLASYFSLYLTFFIFKVGLAKRVSGLSGGVYVLICVKHLPLGKKCLKNRQLLIKSQLLLLSWFGIWRIMVSTGCSIYGRRKLTACCH